MNKKLFAAAILSLTLFAPSAVQAAEKQVVLKVKEMTCQLCAYLVNKELRNIDGVITTKASIKDRLVKITADEKVSNDLLIQAVNKLEYTAEVITQ